MKATAKRGVISEIRRLRLAAGLTQAELAERSGISQNNLCGLERGKHKPRAKTLAKIMAVIGQGADHQSCRAIRCRWCGGSIGAVKWDPVARQLVISDPVGRFDLEHGFFFHSECLDERKGLNAAWPD